MCEYCELALGGHSVLSNCKYGSLISQLCIGRGKRGFRLEGHAMLKSRVPEFAIAFRDIRFCPMCGRKLTASQSDECGLSYDEAWAISNGYV